MVCEYSRLLLPYTTVCEDSSILWLHGGIGIHENLKNSWSYDLAGSNPVGATSHFFEFITLLYSL